MIRGRFAPSPTGPLHFGSLVAAVGSYLFAKSQGGEWHVRIEDLDTPRNVPGAADDMLRTLEALGLEWDGPVVYQSARMDAYASALHRLRASGLTYPCACSRREIADSIATGESAGAAYPGTCRAGLSPGRMARAERVRVDGAAIAFEDRLQGRIASKLADDVGDFVLKRADGPFAYQLAVVVDDADSGITEVVRGADLLDSTPRQIFLQRQLGLPTPRYAHLPVATDATGAKLSKQTAALRVDGRAPAEAIRAALRFLGQPVPGAAADRGPREMLDGAIAQFDSTCIPRVAAAAVTNDGELVA
jgi:glutamyl-Q tRNA(Asp) synthetase